MTLTVSINKSKYCNYFCEYKYAKPMINGNDTNARKPNAIGSLSLSGVRSNFMHLFLFVNKAPAVISKD